MRSVLGPAVKSLLFAGVTVTATAVLAVSIAQTDVGDTTGYKARFTDVSGLRPGDGVRIAGVEVGRVRSIRVVDHRVAQIGFTVERGRPLPASATATIKYLNLVGQRYVELDQGAGGPGTLPPGGTIPEDRTTPALNLTELFNGFQPLFEALSPGDVNRLAGEIVQVLQGEGGTVEGLLSTVASLTTTLAGKDQVIGRVIDNLGAVVDTVGSRSAEFATVLGTLQRLVSGLAADRGSIGAAVGALDDLTTSTAALLQQGRGPLKDDITQLGRLANGLDDNKATVERFLKTLPVKMRAIGRIASYGSWLNLYLCQATLTGVTYRQYPGESHPPPGGIPIAPEAAARCGK